MKKAMRFFLLIAVVLFMSGCSSSAGQDTQDDKGTSKTQPGKTESKDDKTETKDDKTETKDDKTSAEQDDKGTSKTQPDNAETEDDKTTLLEHPQAADYIQSAINYANKIAGSGLVMDDEGNFFATGDSSMANGLVALYSCYGKDIKQIRNWGTGSLLILTEDGNVYHNAALVSSGHNVVDILWKTNNVNINAVFLLGNGKCVVYQNNFETTENEYSAGQLGIAACRWREDVMVLDAEGDYKCSERWENCEVKGWKNIVVLARTANMDTGTATIAGIAADGTVYATGDYAEDILSWGELAYISMDDTLIVGLKKDGTLAFTGELGEMYSALDPVKGVKGVRLWRGRLWAITENDILYSYYEHAADAKIESPYFSLKMDQEGNIYEHKYFAEDGSDKWVLSDYPKADAENRNGLILYQLLLLNSKDIKRFAVKDMNNDGVDEIITEQSGVHYVYAGDHGDLNNALIVGQNGFHSKNLIGYYPNAGIAVLWDSFSNTDCYVEIPERGTFLSIENARSTYQPKEKIFYKGSDIITEEEFNEILKSYIGEEELCIITDEDFLENTEENLRKTFLK